MLIDKTMGKETFWYIAGGSVNGYNSLGEQLGHICPNFNRQT